MSTDVDKRIASILRHRAEELRKLRGEEAFKPFSLKPTAAWAKISEGVVSAVADQLDDIARDILAGKAPG